MNKICVIGLYFGNLPRYFPLWLKSCEKNSTIDFYVFTDAKHPEGPPNVFFIETTLFDVQKRATDVLGFPAKLGNPYKCCDYKPLYGLVFSDYVGEYDYWGHCDFDMIFGDLQAFFDKYDLYKYDRFLTLGHLSLYRNTKEVNERYRCEGSNCDFKTVFSYDRSFVFDESGMTQIYLKNNFPLFKKRIFADISYHQRFRLLEKYPYDEKAINRDYQVFFWEDGKVFCEYLNDGTLLKDEYIYIHFQKRPDFDVVFDEKNCNAFYLTSKGFFEKTSDVTISEIEKYNPFPGERFEKKETKKFERNRNRVERRWRWVNSKTNRFLQDKKEIIEEKFKIIFSKKAK